MLLLERMPNDRIRPEDRARLRVCVLDLPLPTGRTKRTKLPKLSTASLDPVLALELGRQRGPALNLLHPPGRCVRGGRDASRFYLWNLPPKRRSGGVGNLASFKHDPSMPDDTVTVDYLLDTMVIRGSPGRVADEILKLRDAVGPFGTLLYCGHDWADERLARRSMVLMAEKVMPRVLE